MKVFEAVYILDISGEEYRGFALFGANSKGEAKERILKEYKNCKRVVSVLEVDEWSVKSQKRKKVGKGIKQKKEVSCTNKQEQKNLEESVNVVKLKVKKKRGRPRKYPEVLYAKEE